MPDYWKQLADQIEGKGNTWTPYITLGNLFIHSFSFSECFYPKQTTNETYQWKPSEGKFPSTDNMSLVPRQGLLLEHCNTKWFFEILFTLCI